MSKYNPTPHRQKMLTDATMRPTKRNRRSKAQSVALKPLLLVYPNGAVWLSTDDGHTLNSDFVTPGQAAAFLQDLIERAQAQAQALTGQVAHER